ncbi:MAG: DUF7948 domain-containing protein, partial [Anaerolineae bacterium]
MRNRLLVALLLLSSTVAPALATGGGAAAQRPTSARPAPLLFVENVGQFDDVVRFQVRGGAAALWLTDDCLWLTVIRGDGVALHPGQSTGEANLRLSFAGAAATMRLEPFGLLPTSVTYMSGSEAEGLRPRAYSGVRYLDVYPGVDLEIGSEEGVLLWRWRGRNGADATVATLSIEGTDGATITAAGILRLTTAIGAIDLPLPTLEGAVTTASVQAVGPGQVTIAPAFVPPAATVTTAAATGLSYLTYLGGSDREDSGGLAVDDSGAAYAAGSAYSPDFPTTPGVIKSTVEYSDAFVTKLSPDGSAVVFSTLLGGTNRDGATNVVLGADGSVYLVGSTHSADFPTTDGVYDRTFGGGACFSHGPPYDFPCSDAFVAKISADGTSLLWSTFVGGSEADHAAALLLEAGGNMVVAGTTRSADFPTTAG